MNWAWSRLGFESSLIQTGPFGSQLSAEDYIEGGIPLVNPAHIVGGRVQPDARVTVDDDTARRLSRHRLVAGDLIFARRGELGRSAVVTGSSPLLTGTGSILVRLKRERVLPQFVGWYVRRSWVAEWLSQMSVGSTMDNLNTSILGALPLPVPPLDVQRAIADFLDRKTAALDALIDKKECLLALLQEKRQALITQAVTKGLDPNVPRKDSGIEWLGEIPAHWEVKRLKHLRRGALQYGANASTVDDDPTCPRFIRITDIAGADSLRDDTRLSLPWAEAAPYLLEPSDVLLARSGATVGKSFIYRHEHGPACFAGYLIRVRLDQGQMTAEFFWRFTTSEPYLEQVRRAQIQATIQNVGAQRYAEFLVPVPPLHEQKQIEHSLRAVLSPLHDAETQLARSTDLIREYRQALITAAVTGQLDVSAQNA